jgi:hypothetical protein
MSRLGPLNFGLNFTSSGPWLMPPTSFAEGTAQSLDDLDFSHCGNKLFLRPNRSITHPCPPHAHTHSTPFSVVTSTSVSPRFSSVFVFPIFPFHFSYLLSFLLSSPFTFDCCDTSFFLTRSPSSHSSIVLESLSLVSHSIA